MTSKQLAFTGYTVIPIKSLIVYRVTTGTLASCIVLLLSVHDRNPKSDLFLTGGSVTITDEHVYFSYALLLSFEVSSF